MFHYARWKFENLNPEILDTGSMSGPLNSQI